MTQSTCEYSAAPRYHPKMMKKIRVFDESFSKESTLG